MRGETESRGSSSRKGYTLSLAGSSSSFHFISLQPTFVRHICDDCSGRAASSPLSLTLFVSFYVCGFCYCNQQSVNNFSLLSPEQLSIVQTGLNAVGDKLYIKFVQLKQRFYWHFIKNKKPLKTKCHQLCEAQFTQFFLCKMTIYILFIKQNQIKGMLKTLSVAYFTADTLISFANVFSWQTVSIAC